LTKLDAISAAITCIKWPAAPPPPADLHCPLSNLPMPTLSLDNDNSNKHHNMQQPPLSIHSMLIIQTLHTMQTVLVALVDTVEQIMHSTTYPTTSISGSPPATVLPSTTMTTICHKLTTQPPPVNPHPPQIPPWLLSHVHPCNKCIPAQKVSPYCKYIPAKPPFPGHHHCSCNPMMHTKDHLCPPRCLVVPES